MSNEPRAKEILVLPDDIYVRTKFSKDQIIK